jgi:hypothetical protein
MNIIRTKVVELSELPVIAYKVKLASGGSGIKLHRTDIEASAFAAIDKRTGETRVDGRADAKLFPPEAFDEAAELLAGLPYSARGKVKIAVSEAAEDEEIAVSEDEPTEVERKSMADSDEYEAIAGLYSDMQGKINLPLMNKQFIQFAAGSKTVADMVGNRASVDEILTHIVKSRAAYLAGKRESLSDADTAALIETIEETDPRGAFKELKLYLRKRLAR